MKSLIKTITLVTLFTFSFVSYAAADPANWSTSDNRCPKVSDKFYREVGQVSGELGTYYWCYWRDVKGVHHLTMRPSNQLGGFDRTLQPLDKKGTSFYKNYLLTCAQDYVNGLGFCGEV